MPKRQAPEDAAQRYGRLRKKQKISEARSISVSKGGPLHNSLGGLPTSIDVERFVDSRTYEINAMIDAMKTAREGTTKRAWQLLPRHLRRRAASHDIRRVPVRLRLKAKFEIDEPKRNHRKHPKKHTLGKKKRISRTEILLRRQRSKVWLESHIWHAKRMKMAQQWGYRLSLHTTEKSYRMSHREALNGSILNDISYFSTIEVRGFENLVKQVLQSICDPSDVTSSSKRCSTGARACETNLYHFSAYPLRLIGPVTVMWRPLESSGGPSESSQPIVDASVVQLSTKAIRSIWIRFHPAIFDEVSEAVQAASSAALKSFGNAGFDQSTLDAAHIDIIDLRGGINAFEIIGPTSGEVLQRVLRTVQQEMTVAKIKAMKTAFRARPGSVPQGMVLHLTAWDPRLQAPSYSCKHEDLSSATSDLLIQPSPGLAQGSFWDVKVRDGLRSKKFKNAELNERRRKHTVPGKPLKPSAEDDRVPCLLVQRSIGTPTAQRGMPNSGSSVSSMCGWTVLLPAGWSMPFLTAMVYAGVKVGGLRERHTQHFEAGPAAAERFFPNDCVTSCEYDRHITQVASTTRAKWERTPPAKRFNYKTVEGSEGLAYDRWIPDWAYLLTLNVDESEHVVAEEPLTQYVPIPTQPPIIQTKTPPAPQSSRPIQPWLLLGKNIRALIQSMVAAVTSGSRAQDVLHSRILEIREKRGLNTNFCVQPDDLFSSALISVNVHIVGRGCPKDNAVVYELNPEQMIRERERLLHNQSEHVSLVENECVGAAGTSGRLLGFVTTGRFSLLRGRGHAVATISLPALIRILGTLNPSVSQGPGPEFDDTVLARIRNREETCYWLARLKLL